MTPKGIGTMTNQLILAKANAVLENEVIQAT